MRILYVASDQRIPAPTGGSIHVHEVAAGLSRLGHEMHVVALTGESPPKPLPYRLHPSQMLVAHRAFRWSSRGFVEALIREHDIGLVIERYYNFGGEGIRAAANYDLPSILEVNSPVRDHPGSNKALLDALFLFRPMRRIRERLCDLSSAIVTPLESILPESVDRTKVHRVHWGANVERFRPDVEPAQGASAMAIPRDRRVIVFSGSFRKWHGADALVDIARRVLDGPQGHSAFFMFLGQGPQLDEVARRVTRSNLSSHVVLTGGVPYDEVPGYLARASIGVAPYRPSRHRQMSLGFYWSPLKIFEYMAMGLPVVTLKNDALAEIIRDDREGYLLDEHDEDGWVHAIERLLEDPDRARIMGRSARKRVKTRFSWQRHCEQLDGIIREFVGSGATASR